MEEVKILKSKEKYGIQIQYHIKRKTLLQNAVDKNGKTIIKNKSFIEIYPKTIHFSNNGINWIIADHNGKKIYDQTFSFCRSPIIMDSDRYIILDKKRTLDLKDLNGRNLLPFHFKTILDWNRNFLAVLKSGKAGVFNRDGEEILAPIYDNIRILGEDLFEVIMKENRALYQKDIGFVTDFDDYRFTSFHGGIGGYSRHGIEWGLVDSEGNMANVPDLEELEYLDDGYFIFSFEKEKWGVIDDRQKVLIPPKYSGISALGEGHIGLKKDLKTGVVNTQGIKILPFMFSYIESFDGKNFLCKDRNGYQFYDDFGDHIFNEYYSDARPFINGVAFINMKDKNYLLNEYGDALLL